MKKKTIIHSSIISLAVIIGCRYLFWGKHGIEIEHQSMLTIKKKEIMINQLHTDIKNLERELTTWQNSSFLKEKIAREDLQMSSTHEWIYFIK